MTAIPIYLDDHRRVRSPHRYAVYVREYTADLWEPIELEPEMLDIGSGSTVDRCLLRQRYGFIKSYGESYYRVVSPVPTELANWFIKVEITPDLKTVATTAERDALTGMEDGALVYVTAADVVYRYVLSTDSWTDHTSVSPRKLTWFGVVTGMRREAHGGDVLGESGDMIVEAMGMEVLMTRKQIRTSVVEDEAGVSVKTVGRGIAFNSHRGDRSRGEYATENMSDTLGSDGVEVFASDLTTAENWSSGDIVEHLLYYHNPSGDSSFDWLLDASSKTLLSTFIPLDVQCDGRTLFEVINQVIPRKRGLVWWLQVDDSTDDITLYVDTISPSDVILPSGETITANRNPRSIAIDYTPDLARYREQYDSLRRYEQVIVEGGRQGAIFTVSIADGTLEEDWTEDQETAYKRGAMDVTGYNALDRSEKLTVSDRLRAGDDLRRVFTRFRVPWDWDGTAKNGTGDGTVYNVFPVLPANPTGLPTVNSESESYWQPGLRFENRMPLKAGWKYDTGTYQPLNENVEGTVAEYRRPFAVFPLKREDGTEAWCNAHNAGLANIYDELRNKGQSLVSCTVTVHDEQLGVNCTPNGPSHIMDYTGSYDGSDANIAPSHVGYGQVDYNDVAFTVYCKADNRVSASYPETSETIPDQDAIHVIRLGDRCRVDVVAPGTIVDVGEGGLRRTNVYCMARDDRAVMRDIAREAWIWYSTPRVAIDLQFNQISNQFRIGDLVTSVRYGYRYMKTASGTVLMLGDKPWARGGSTDRVVNSAITQVNLNFVSGTTSVRTDYSEIDFELDFEVIA